VGIRKSDYFVSLMVFVFFCLKRGSTSFELSGLGCCLSWSKMDFLSGGFMLGTSAARSFFGAIADFFEGLSPSFEDTHIHTLTDCESIHTLNNAVRIYLCRHMLTVHIYTPPWVSLYGV
jgi:hypothetical protein